MILLLLTGELELQVFRLLFIILKLLYYFQTHTKFKILQVILLFIFIRCPLLFADSHTPIHKEDSIEICLKSFVEEIDVIENKYNIILYRFDEELSQLTIDLTQKDHTKHTTLLLVKHLLIKDSINIIRRMRSADINKVRYTKGLEIIKILYEKTLALDHHFTTVNTLHDMQKLSNPNNYQEFALARNKFLSKTDKKSGFNLSSILGDNIYTTIIHSMISLFNNDGINKLNKKEMMEGVECIMDFTLRMNSDLNTIYYESAYLKNSNEDIIAQIEGLFSIYTKPIHYELSLKQCRDNDDWFAIYDNLQNYIDRLNFISSKNTNKANEMQIDLEFSIDRLVHFIYQYNTFINQSGKFYEKFAVMLNSYKNEAYCAKKIPQEFLTLRENINIAIDKFHNTYKPVEITGSKLKQLLYGIKSYD